MDVPPALVIALVVGALYVGAVVYAIVQIVRTRELSDVERLIWVVAVLWAPLIGALVWFFAGPHPFGFRLTRQIHRE